MMEKNRQTVHCWILDFTLSMVWKDFVEYGTVDRMNNRDLIQWIVAQQVFEGEEELRQIYILSLLCRLVDGEGYEMKYTEDSQLTVLEDAADVLEILLRGVEEPVLDEGRDLLEDLKNQAVYVCCRDDNFDVAEEVYNRQFAKQARTRSENKENKEILTLLKSRNPRHSTLNSQKYTHFLSKAQKFLKQFIKTEEPVLLQMAGKQWKSDSTMTDKCLDKYQERPDRVQTEERLDNYQDRLDRTQTEERLDNSQDRPDRTQTEERLDNYQDRPDRTQTEERLDNYQDRPDRTQTEERLGKYQDKRVTLGTLQRVQKNIGVPEESSSLNFMEQRDLKEHLQKVNAEKRKHNNNVNANSVSPRMSSSPKRRKFTESSNSGNTSRKSLGTRIYEKHDLNPRVVLNADLPKLKTTRHSQPAVSTCSSPGKLRTPWLNAEVNDFYRGVQIFGVGNWTQIKDAMKTNRSNVHLKDKWRNILKSGEINRLVKEFGPVKK